MKSLKFDHVNAGLIQSGQKHITWRIDDDKDLRVGDVVTVVDKLNPGSALSWKVIGTGQINSITEKRIGDLTDKDKQEHGGFAMSKTMLNTLRKYYGTQVSEETPIKIIDFKFTPGYIQSADDAADIIPDGAPSVKLYADGGSRGNPGPSASGYVLYGPGDKILVKDGLYLGITTNNQAEYNALRLGLEKALELKARTVEVFLDSLLVVNQMKGTYKVRNRELIPVHRAIKDLEARFDKVTFSHVPRELNKVADGMVNEILDATDL